VREVSLEGSVAAGDDDESDRSEVGRLELVGGLDVFTGPIDRLRAAT
jgi:hypothetical protein